MILELRLDNYNHKWSIMNKNLLKTRKEFMNIREWPGKPMRARILLSLIPYFSSQEQTSLSNVIQNKCGTAVYEV